MGIGAGSTAAPELRRLYPAAICVFPRNAGQMTQLYVSCEGNVNTAEPYICTALYTVCERHRLQPMLL